MQTLGGHYLSAMDAFRDIVNNTEVTDHHIAALLTIADALVDIRSHLHDISKELHDFDHQICRGIVTAKD
jgi:hypothetical protein